MSCCALFFNHNTSMKRTNLFLLMLVIATVATAKPRRAAEMRQIAQQVLSKTSAEAATMVLLDEAQGYAVYGHEQGFAIISKNDSQTPVLGYSSTPYNKDDMPCAFRYWLNAVSTSLEAGTTDPLNQEYDEVAPLLTTTWGQGDPFNSMCPKVNGALAPTGCVATAMAQILYFYRYPVQGRARATTPWAPTPTDSWSTSTAPTGGT